MNAASHFYHQLTVVHDQCEGCQAASIKSLHCRCMLPVNDIFSRKNLPHLPAHNYRKIKWYVFFRYYQAYDTLPPFFLSSLSSQAYQKNPVAMDGVAGLPILQHLFWRIPLIDNNSPTFQERPLAMQQEQEEDRR